VDDSGALLRRIFNGFVRKRKQNKNAKLVMLEPALLPNLLPCSFVLTDILIHLFPSPPYVSQQGHVTVLY